MGYVRSSLTGLRSSRTAAGKLIHDYSYYRHDEGLAEAKRWTSPRKAAHDAAGASAGG